MSRLVVFEVASEELPLLQGEMPVWVEARQTPITLDDQLQGQHREWQILAMQTYKASNEASNEASNFEVDLAIVYPKNEPIPEIEDWSLVVERRYSPDFSLRLLYDLTGKAIEIGCFPNVPQRCNELIMPKSQIWVAHEYHVCESGVDLGLFYKSISVGYYRPAVVPANLGILNTETLQ